MKKKRRATTMLVMQKRNPDRLDMRYKANRLWVQQTRQAKQLALPF